VKILTANNEDELRKAIPEADVMVTSNRVYVPEPARIIRDGGKRLKWIQFTTSGIDKAVASGLPEGIPVTNAAGFHANRVAEHAFSLLLAVARRHMDAGAARPKRAWIRDEVSPLILTLEKATMVIVGLGSIGQSIARKAKAFDMRVIGISRSADALPNIDEMRPRERLVETLRQADVVAMAATYDESTHHILNAPAIAALKPKAIIVNIARGLLIDEPAMIAALKANRIYGAGLDVMATEPLPADSPLWDMPNVVMTPHTAGAGGDKTDPIVNIITDNLTLFLAGKPLNKLVHGPMFAKVPA
jgi:phosphoglycerate dehydrogenase-like enzyme